MNSPTRTLPTAALAPPSVLDLIRLCPPASASFSEPQKTAFAGLEYFYRKGFGYAEMMNAHPQTLGHSLADSPVGMLAFYYDKFTERTHSNRQPEKALTRDDMLDKVTLYLPTNTCTSGAVRPFARRCLPETT